MEKLDRTKCEDSDEDFDLSILRAPQVVVVVITIVTYFL
jgi:hypothetical protein